jgi:hypothetical protein
MPQENKTPEDIIKEIYGKPRFRQLHGSNQILFIKTMEEYGRQEFDRAIELCKQNLRASSNVAHQSEIFDNLKIK